MCIVSNVHFVLSGVYCNYRLYLRWWHLLPRNGVVKLCYHRDAVRGESRHLLDERDAMQMLQFSDEVFKAR